MFYEGLGSNWWFYQGSITPPSLHICYQSPQSLKHTKDNYSIREDIIDLWGVCVGWGSVGF